MIKEKIYRHIYDNNKNTDGTEKPNELLGEFEVNDGEMDGYSFEAIGIKDGKKYRIIGQEVSGLMDKYNAGTKCFVELIDN